MADEAIVKPNRVALCCAKNQIPKLPTQSLQARPATPQITAAGVFVF